ncbi:EAL domain-containing protein [Sphingomonas sp. BIUV-7]|uniref:EAL domain-containing protein n=1 Tax=Sphingomonas natans TaxID=3063330 RepID=A0ABT8Y908_9SPHN|nr:EAL domain-containing protein [Sphingomonas sp. BIUV-7]MDO6414815.1 EAL domain-containing protein [Sphingomonas sp. BIUV-7]
MGKISGGLIRTQPFAGAPGDMALSFPSASATALQQYLDALPIAAGVAVLGDNGPRFLARNEHLVRMRNRVPDANLGDFIARVMRHLTSDTESESYAWEEPGVGGRHFQVHLTPLDAHPVLGRRLMMSLIDCTAAIETERSLRFGMLHDSLTGLPNRLAFSEAIETMLETDEDDVGGFAVLALDLTRFSRINEGIGSLAGDELILTVASRLRSVLRPQDMLARMAADEFAVLVPLTEGPGDALHVARRLQESLAYPLRLSELEIKIDCAIGCALWHENALGAGDIIRNGQFALKRAKRSGRIEVYQPGEAGRARRRFSLETELRRAIEADQLDLAFQPLVDLETRTISGFETLARWNHPDRGAIPPIEFITVAEESGLILPLGRWVIDRAVETLASWDRQAGGPLPIYFSINVSAVQLARDSVASAVADALRRHDLPGDRITLELTESSIVADPDRASDMLDALKALSCRIAMDDFGTGYSSLAYLQRLPIDVLKIDRQFVSAMFDDKDSTAIIRAILSLANALGMTTIAEGIETANAAHLLAALGATTGQGYHFAKPMPAAQAFQHLVGRKAA